ncbi:MAG: hypothetical protein DME26_01495 [Verrucomicrobia bacterium]|nr:MAG: hypothetical protein DME26_01495 [Verrucomicrobiota bacterium]
MGIPDRSKVWLWDAETQSFGAPTTFSTGSGWSTDIQLSVGRGFVLKVPSPSLITFIGVVPEGLLTNFVAGNNKLSLVGSIVPQSASLSVLQYPGTDKEIVYLWNSTNQLFKDSITYFAGYGWSGGSGSNGPVIPSAHSFFVQRPGPDANWIRDFSLFATLFSGALAQSVAELSISSTSISNGSVELQIPVAKGGFYNVLFSSDGTTWTAIATNQTGTVWTGPFRGGVRGYYRALKSEK